MPSTNQNSQFLLFVSGATTTYSPSNTKYSLKCFNISYKLLESFLIWNYFFSNAKKYK